MKYNKFLMALTLSLGISSNIHYCADAPTSWSNLGNTLTWAPKKAYQTLTTHTSQTLNYITNIPVSIFNSMSSWSTNKILTIIGAGIAILIGLGLYNKDTLTALIDGFIDQAEENPQKKEIIAINLPNTGIQFQETQKTKPSLEAIFTKQDTESWITYFNRLYKSEFNPKKDSKPRTVYTEEDAYEASMQTISNILIAQNPSLIQIAQLQNEFESDKQKTFFLNNALRNKYIDEYMNKIKLLPNQEKLETMKEFMSQVASNEMSPHKQEILQSAGLTQGLNVSTIGEYDGLNFGQNGLRYQALDFIFKIIQTTMNNQTAKQH